MVLIRHGETDWSRSGQHTGRTDIPLTDEGRRQAERIRTALAGFDFVLVLVSPLQRARETAALIGLGDAKLSSDLAEWDYGAYEGLTSAQIHEQRPGWSLWVDGCPGGEDAAAVGERADRVLDEVRTADGDVALVAHGHLLRVLTARWLQQEPACGRLYRLDTASVSHLGHERAQPVIELWNSRIHLALG